MRPSDTKDRLLDAAERLFALEGFHNTSLRAITGAAGVNLASVHYHFGSKEALLEALVDRRLLPLNAVRRERLENVRETALGNRKAMRVRDVLGAFVEPTLHFRESGPGAQEFLSLIGRALAEPDDTIRRTFMQRMEPLFLLLYDLLGEALPGTPRDLLFWRLHFALGALSHTICLAGKFKLLPPGVDPPTDAATMTDLLLTFITAGMETS